MTLTHRIPETENWVRMGQISRRAAIAGGAAAVGYALAAQPVAATAIRTGTEGLTEGMVSFPTGTIKMNAYRARPASGDPAPVILVVQEVFGLHEWIKDITRRLAHAGYYAIAPDLYQRQGDATRYTDIKALVADIVSKVPDEQVMADLDAAARFTAADGGNSGRLGITGFCWGGRATWLYSAHNPVLKAGVAWYGRLTSEATELQPLVPLQLAPKLNAPVLGLYGTVDKGIPVSDVQAMNKALEAASSKSRIKLFEGADHGFLADYRPSFHEAAAKQGWADALEWFKQYL